MRPDDAIDQILRSLHAALADIPASIAALTEQEAPGESANGAVRVAYGALGDLKRVEVERDFLHSASRQRIEAALLDAFAQAERAAEAARAEFGGGLTFMGVPLGTVLRGGSISSVLPPMEETPAIFDRG
jgi:DNA-binding protein YbaB